MNLTNNKEKKHTCTYLWISWNLQQPFEKHEIRCGPQWCKSLHERAMWNLELVAWWIATWIWSWKMIFWCSSKSWKPYLKSMVEYFIYHLFANLVHQQAGFETRYVWLRLECFHNQNCFYSQGMPAIKLFFKNSKAWWCLKQVFTIKFYLERG